MAMHTHLDGVVCQLYCAELEVDKAVQFFGKVKLPHMLRLKARCSILVSSLSLSLSLSVSVYHFSLSHKSGRIVLMTAPWWRLDCIFCRFVAENVRDSVRGRRSQRGGCCQLQKQLIVPQISQSICNKQICNTPKIFFVRLIRGTWGKVCWWLGGDQMNTFAVNVTRRTRVRPCLPLNVTGHRGSSKSNAGQT